MTYKIVTKYIKDLSFEIKDAKSYFLLEKNIKDFTVNFDIKSKPYKVRTLPARHVLKSRTFWCTARKAAQAAMLARCTELHGPASH